MSFVSPGVSCLSNETSCQAISLSRPAVFRLFLDDIRQPGAPGRCATRSAGATPQRGGVSCWRIYGRSLRYPCAFDHAPYWLASLGALGGTSQYWRGWTPHLPALRCLTGCLRHPSSGRTPCGGASSGPPGAAAPGQPLSPLRHTQLFCLRFARQKTRGPMAPAALVSLACWLRQCPRGCPGASSLGAVLLRCTPPTCRAVGGPLSAGALSGWRLPRHLAEGSVGCGWTPRPILLAENGPPCAIIRKAVPSEYRCSVAINGSSPSAFYFARWQNKAAAPDKSGSHSAGYISVDI